MYFDAPTPEQAENIRKLKESINKNRAIRDTEYSNINTTPVGGFSSFMKELVVPTTYVKGLFGADQPVTMDSYPEDAQHFLKYLVKNSGEGPVSWGKWFDQASNYQVEQSNGKLTKENSVDQNLLNFARPVSDQLFHPINQVHNTLGQFNIGVNPDTSEYIINDRFNFEKDDATHAISPRSAWWDPRFPLAKLGNLVVPKGKPFKINTGVFQNSDSQ